MSKPKYKRIPIYVYVQRQQTGFSKFVDGLLVTDDENHYFSVAYQRFYPSAPKDVYSIFSGHEMLISQQGEVRLHCKGDLRSKWTETQLPRFSLQAHKIPIKINQREIFLRRLTNPERKYLQKEFDRLGRGKSLRIQLHD